MVLIYIKHSIYRVKNLTEIDSYDFMQQVTIEFCNEQQVIFYNERILRRVASEFLQRATSAASNWFKYVTVSDLTTSNEQRVKSYVSLVQVIMFFVFVCFPVLLFLCLFLLVFLKCLMLQYVRNV